MLMSHPIKVEAFKILDQIKNDNWRPKLCIYLDSAKTSQQWYQCPLYSGAASCFLTTLDSCCWIRLQCSHLVTSCFLTKLSQAVSWPSWTAAAGSGYNAQAKAVGDVISLEMPESTQSIFNLLQSAGSQEAYFIFDNIVFRQQARKCTCEVNWK